MVNPKQKPFNFRVAAVPREALPNIKLDDLVIKNIDPLTWVVCGFTLGAISPPIPSPSEMPIAEKLRLMKKKIIYTCVVERLLITPKRAKNTRALNIRQHQRCAKRE